MTTNRVHTATSAGPTRLELVQHSGHIELRVDPDATHATVSITSTAESGPTADAVAKTTFSQLGQNLRVEVPTDAHSGGVVFNSGSSTVMSFGSISGGIVIGNENGSSMIFGGVSGPVSVNGVDVTDYVNAQSGGAANAVVRTCVVLPRGSEAVLDAGRSTIETQGRLTLLDYSASSGRLTAQSVARLDVKLAMGSADVREVTEEVRVYVSSGSVDIASYSGSAARVSVSSGSVNLHAEPHSTGRLDVSVSSGTAHITGAGHLQVRQRCSTGSITVV